MALQESLEEGYKDDYPADDGGTVAGTHPDFSKPCRTCCRRTTRSCWASRERVESRRQVHSNFVAVSAPRPLKLRCSDPSLPPAQAAPAPAAAGAAAGAVAAGSPQARRPQRQRSRRSRRVGAKTPQTSSHRSSVAPFTGGPCAWQPPAAAPRRRPRRRRAKEPAGAPVANKSFCA